MGAFVLDAFALMALFQDEPGAPRLQTLIREAQQERSALHIAVVNLGEVVYSLQNRRGLDTAVGALGAVESSPIKIVDVDRSLALAAARLKASFGIGYLDCFVAALAQQLQATVVTGDPDFKKVESIVNVEWLFG